MDALRRLLEQKLAGEADVEKRIRITMQFIMNYGDYQPRFGMVVSDEIEAMSAGLPIAPLGRAYAQLCRSFCLVGLGQYKESYRLLRESTEELARLGDEDGRLLGYVFKGFEEVAQGHLDVALQYGLEGLRWVEQLDPEQHQYGRVWLRYALGVFYFNLNDYDTSLMHYRAGRDYALSYGDSYALARCLSGLGTVLIAKGAYDEAIEAIERSIVLFEEALQLMGLSRALNDLGMLERRRSNFSLAADYLQRSLAIRREMGYQPGIITTLLEIGALHIDRKEYAAALPFLQEGLELAESASAGVKIYTAHQLLAGVYKHTGDPARALAHFEKFYEQKNSITGAETANRLKVIETNFATERSAKEAEIHRLKNVELKRAFDEIETKNREILDSITYARRLQQAIIPSEERFRGQLPGAFVLYLPRDIVSGDFYWMEKINGKILFAAVDCTGHGVPGAFVSIVGANSLNRCVHEFGMDDPGAILTRLSQLVAETFSRSGEQVNDGMDVALCCYDPQQGKLRYAGAFNDLYHFRQGLLTEYKADKYPIGSQFGEINYRTMEIDLAPDDMIYIFTDGYADQFGGPRGKKFKKKQLQANLAGLSALPPAEQKTQLEQVFENWKDRLEQVDDVLVIGVKF